MDFDSKYKNWSQVVLGTKYVRDVLEEVLEQEVQCFKNEVLTQIRDELKIHPTLAILCDGQNIIPKPKNHFLTSKYYCEKHDADDISKCTQPCPNAVCWKIRQKIIAGTCKRYTLYFFILRWV